jgi:tetratricopeptide (TPR) repeat protein
MIIPLKICIAGFFSLTILEGSAALAQLETKRNATELNNEGVCALKKHEWPESIQKFNAALKEDPNFQLARQNLAVAHNNLALQLAVKKNSLESALKEFHQAIYLDPDNKTTIGNFNYVLVRLGRKPNNFLDRTKLGDEARTNGDLSGAVVEYLAALKLKNDHQIHKKLRDVYRLLDEKDKAAGEYAAAYRDEK